MKDQVKMKKYVLKNDFFFVSLQEISGGSVGDQQENMLS